MEGPPCAGLLRLVLLAGPLRLCSPPPRSLPSAGPDFTKGGLGGAYDATEFVWKDRRGHTWAAWAVRFGRSAASPQDLPRRYHVVTAWNPDSKPLPAAENRLRNAALAAELRAAARPTRPIVGREPTSSGRGWVEASFVVEGLSSAAAVWWGRTFGQEAVFEVEDDVRRVVFCATGTARRGRRLVWTRGRSGSRVPRA